MMEERRKFVRLNFNVDISWEKSPDKNQNLEVKDAKSKNISAGGICLIVYDEVKVGDCLNLKFTLPSELIIEAKGLIVWTNEFGIEDGGKKCCDAGIQFLNISEDDMAKINKYVFRIV